MVNIFDDFFRKRKDYFSRKPVKDIDFEFKESMKGIKKELDGHLDARNENTSEIQAS